MKTERIVFFSFWLFFFMTIISMYFAMRNAVSMLQIFFIFFAVWSALVGGIVIGLSEKIKRENKNGTNIKK